jgi:carotenoid cleavage dioxygenase
VQHFWNAWQNGNLIELAGCRFESLEFGIEAESSEAASSGTEIRGGVPARYWIDLDSGTAGCEFFDDINGEFCRVNDTYTGVRTDCLYMSGYSREDAGGPDFDTVVKYDRRTGARTSWYAGDGEHLGENVFAPDPNGTAEDDGWLINSAYDSDLDRSEVIVLDARNVEAGPIARVRIPHRMPFGFHANWFAAD